jgi:hypothetical protein
MDWKIRGKSLFYWKGDNEIKILLFFLFSPLESFIYLLWLERDHETFAFPGKTLICMKQVFMTLKWA